MRNFLTTLLLSQGVPMILLGDEVGRTQHGNNNAYCQDDETSWFDWDDLEHNDELHRFVCRLTDLRRDHPVFRRRRWFVGRSIRGSDANDIGWLRPDGSPMNDDDWDAGFAKGLGMVLNGEAIAWPGPRGEPVVDDTFLVVFNAHHEPLEWTAPGEPWAERWELDLDTARPELEGGTITAHPPIKAGDTFVVAGRSIQVLRRTSE